MPKRSCDLCMRRKTRCDNGLPCRKCTDAKPPLECTYLTPVQKRGPKTSKLLRRHIERWDPGGRAARGSAPEQLGLRSHGAASRGPHMADGFDAVSTTSGEMMARKVPIRVLRPVIEAYRSRMYPIWPVVEAEDLLSRLESAEGGDEFDREADILALALCSATMAQLDLRPLRHGSCKVDSRYLERECCRVRSFSEYRQHPSIEGVLASFFLHVHHAKADNRNAAMVFLQEAISLARLLHLDDSGPDGFRLGDDERSRGYLCYMLLWVSERGYAVQHRFPISIHESLEIPSTLLSDSDNYGQGLIELASLFSTFDSQIRRTSKHNSVEHPPSSDSRLLVAIHDTLTTNTPRSANFDIVQRADYHFTKQWMRTLLWQQAMSRGLLSSASDVESMTFLFPSRIAQDLLASITMLSKDDLLPLGRDQLIKSFEITNTLADVILCAPPDSISPISGDSHAPSASQPPQKARHRSPKRECCRYGPPDFLHGLYQTISPFLEYDERLRDMLRQKAADALLRAPSRVVPGAIREKNEAWERGNEGGHAYTEVEESVLDEAHADLPF